MQIFPLAIASTALLLGTHAAAAPECTPKQVNDYQSAGDAIPLHCHIELSPFDVCSDECSPFFEALVKAAPNCTEPWMEGGITKLDVAKYMGDNCKAARESKDMKYIPKETPTLPRCTPDDLSAWKTKYETPFANCTKLLPYTDCTDACLKTLEEGIAAAPVCRGRDNYTEGEYNKYGLARCLIARDEDFKTNKVLQTVAGGSSNNNSVVSNKTNESAGSSKPNDVPSPSAMTKESSASSTTSIRGIATAVVTSLILSVCY